ncbi:hypothetical protein RJ640_001970 [Escallonia rubra]|uniref:Uncharacterized protein n=1 Tax=Escallonia rubra TaxID=112253 RepID=A0AA88UMH2_9ASTE|nr:hypothetical protein RJ640_001970 [Escallonia rubra]
MPTPALSSATLPHPPPAPAPSARSGVASTPSSAASASPSRRTEASPSRTRSGRAALPLRNSRFAVQSTGGQLREEEEEAADSAAVTATASSVAASELRISTFSRSGLLKGRGRETS